MGGTGTYDAAAGTLSGTMLAAGKTAETASIKLVGTIPLAWW